MPLDEEGVPLSDLYGSLLVEEDRTALKKTKKEDEPGGNKTLKSITDMFYIAPKQKELKTLAKRIFLKGEAGHGKTVLCLKIMNTWAKAKRPCNNTYSRSSVKTEESELKGFLTNFEAVFYVPLRSAKRETSSVIGLVCDSIADQPDTFKQKIRQVLYDDKIPCLVALDGLDEWIVPSKCGSNRFPDTDGLINCVLLCTMRPWMMLNLRPGLDKNNDKVLEILGLNPKDIEKVIENVLVNFYGMKMNLDIYKNTFKKYCLKAKHPALESLMRVPLMLTASCVVWEETKNDPTINPDASNYMTGFFLKLMEITVTRAALKHEKVKSFLCEKRQTKNQRQSIPDIPILSHFSHIDDFLGVIKEIGRLALKDLLSEDTHLVFPKIDLEKEIGSENVELALKAGIMSHRKAPSVSYQQRAIVSFYHKSIQEFISALSIACGDKDSFAIFCTNCSSVDKIMKISLVIMFVCGLQPEIGWRLCEHISTVVNNDSDVIQYREMPVLKQSPITSDAGAKVHEMNRMLFKWFDEMKHNPLFTEITSRKMTSTISDVYLDSYCHNDKVDMLREIVGSKNNKIVSLCLNCVKGPVHGIIEHLPVCKNLTSLYIIPEKHTKGVEKLASVLPQFIDLRHLLYSGYSQKEDTNTAVVGVFQNLNMMKCLELKKIDLKKILTLADLPQLEALVLYNVQNTSSLFDLPPSYHCSHLKYIELSGITLNDTVRASNIPAIDTVVLDKVQPASFILRPLPACNRLTTLHVSCFRDKEDRKLLASTLPQLVHLEYIRYQGRYEYDEGDVAVVGSLQQLKLLKSIGLSQINMRDAGTLLLTAEMTQLENVELMHVEMSSRRWEEFVFSLVNVQHTCHVTLEDTNISDEIVDLINKCKLPLFNVSHSMKYSGKIYMAFSIRAS